MRSSSIVVLLWRHCLGDRAISKFLLLIKSDSQVLDLTANSVSDLVEQVWIHSFSSKFYVDQRVLDVLLCDCLFYKLRLRFVHAAACLAWVIHRIIAACTLLEVDRAWVRDFAGTYRKTILVAEGGTMFSLYLVNNFLTIFLSSYGGGCCRFDLLYCLLDSRSCACRVAGIHGTIMSCLHISRWSLGHDAFAPFISEFLGSVAVLIYHRGGSYLLVNKLLSYL